MNTFHSHCRLAFFVFFVAALFACPVSSEIIFESGTLGPTGITGEDVLNQVVRGVNVSAVVFNGVRFEVAKPVKTSQIGGHFVARADSDPSLAPTFFGAIVLLDDQDDFPDSGDLTTPDTIGTTLLTFPEPSTQVFGDLGVKLDPGWYALVFGSGLFGAEGSGAALLNNPDILDPQYIGFQPGFGWSNRPASLDNKRFVLLGTIIPEPSSATVFLPAILVLLGHSRLGKACRVAGGGGGIADLGLRNAD